MAVALTQEDLILFADFVKNLLDVHPDTDGEYIKRRKKKRHSGHKKGLIGSKAHEDEYNSNNENQSDADRPENRENERAGNVGGVKKENEHWDREEDGRRDGDEEEQEPKKEPEKRRGRGRPRKKQTVERDLVREQETQRKPEREKERTKERGRGRPRSNQEPSEAAAQQGSNLTRAATPLKPKAPLRLADGELDDGKMKSQSESGVSEEEGAKGGDRPKGGENGEEEEEEEIIDIETVSPSPTAKSSTRFDKLGKKPFGPLLNNLATGIVPRLSLPINKMHLKPFPSPHPKHRAELKGWEQPIGPRTRRKSGNFIPAALDEDVSDDDFNPSGKKRGRKGKKKRKR